MAPQMLSIAEAAVELGIGESTAYDLIARGEFPLPVQQVGGRMKVSRVRLDQFTGLDERVARLEQLLADAKESKSVPARLGRTAGRDNAAGQAAAPVVASVVGGGSP